MNPQNPPGMFPSSYHRDNVPPSVPGGQTMPVPPPITPPPTNMPPMNVPPPVMPPKKSGKAGDMILGIVIGIAQIPIIAYVFSILASTFQGLSSSVYVYYLIPLVIIVVETVLLTNKGKGHMATGIVIGTVLLPALAFGACLLMLSGSRF